MSLRPKNIKIITTSLPLINAESYRIIFSYTYGNTPPFICERILKQDVLSKHIEKVTGKKVVPNIIELKSPNCLLVADIVAEGAFAGIPNSKFTLNAATAFKLSGKDRK